MSRKVPVTVIGGFLGAGKTTLINRLLACSFDRRTAVLVNDFGAASIDERLIESCDGGVTTLTNGCICCSLQGNLVEQVHEIVRRTGPACDHLIIEASGISDSGEILRALGYPRIRELIAVSAVVTVVDATRFGILTGASRKLAERQVLAADLVLMSKLDAAPQAQAGSARAACEALGVRCLESTQAPALWDALFALERSSTSTPAFAAPGPPAESSFEHWSFSEPGPYTLQALRRTLASLCSEIYRVKGFIDLQEAAGAKCVVQVVGDRVEIRRADGKSDEARNMLVFIGARGRVDWTHVAERLRSCRGTQH